MHTGKIPNTVSVLAYFYAVFYQFYEKGLFGIFFSTIQSILIFLILFPLYLSKNLGAGDIKLLCAAAVFLGWKRALGSFGAAMFIAAFSIFCKKRKEKKEQVKKIPLAGPIFAGILLVLFKEGFF